MLYLWNVLEHYRTFLVTPYDSLSTLVDYGKVDSPLADQLCHRVANVANPSNNEWFATYVQAQNLVKA